MSKLFRILALLKLELYRYFVSPISYTLLALFLLISGFLFSFHIEQTLEANLRFVLLPLGFFAMMFTPLISMGSFAEEHRLGTVELLLTAPVYVGEIVLAKFFAAWVFYLFLLFPTLSYLGIFLYYGAFFPLASTFTFYLGLSLQAAYFLSLGIWISSCTKSQVLSAFFTFSCLLGIYLLYWLYQYLPSSFWTRFLGYFSWQYHFESFEKGILSSRNIGYFLLNTLFFLFLTYWSLKWKQEG